jgi:hypothetical protein
MGEKAKRPIVFNGEPGGIRTRDPLIKSQVLYRLSYGLGTMGADHRRVLVRGQCSNRLGWVTLCYRNGSQRCHNVLARTLLSIYATRERIGYGKIICWLIK